MLLLQTINNYKPSLCNDQKYAFVQGASNNKMYAITLTWMIPVPMEWAPMFVDCPNFSTAFHWLVDLFDSQLIRSWGRRAMALAGEVTRHGQAHSYSWSVTIVSLSGQESDERSHRSEWKPNS